MNPSPLSRIDPRPPSGYLPLAQARPPSRGRLAFAASLLCFVHCAGSALLLPLLPAAVAIWTENPLIERGLLAVSVLSTALRLQGARGRGIARVLWLVASVAGLVASWRHNEPVLLAALAALAGTQLHLLVVQRGPSR